MGTPVEEIVVGQPCGNWDPPAETPEFMYAFFWDILNGNLGPPIQIPNIHVFKMTQTVGDKCIWVADSVDFGWWCQFGLQVAQCWLTLGNQDVPKDYYFHHTKGVSPPAEYELFTNFWQVPWVAYGYQGYGTIFWLEQALELSELFGLDWLTDLMLEIFPVGTDEFVVKFCSKRLTTNVKMKLPR